MEINYSSRFLKQFKKLPQEIQERCAVAEILFKEDPFCAQLRIHKLTGKFKEFWSFSINNKYRVLVEFYDPDEVLFLAIGGHEIYK